MVKWPRDVRPGVLIHLLESYGFQVVRQSGSHIVLKHFGPPEFSVIIPNHVPIKVGTLHSILTSVAGHLRMDPTELAEKL